MDDGGPYPPGELYRAFTAFMVIVICVLLLAIPVMVIAKIVEVLNAS